jgi:hypothetical protein
MLPDNALVRLNSTGPGAGGRGSRQRKQYNVPAAHGHLRLALRPDRNARIALPWNRIGRWSSIGSNPLRCQCRTVFL